MAITWTEDDWGWSARLPGGVTLAVTKKEAGYEAVANGVHLTRELEGQSPRVALFDDPAVAKAAVVDSLRKDLGAALTELNLDG